jgi:hypothetical protein
LKYDLTIERIDNGYIFSGEGVTDGKHYYRNLEAFGNSLIEELRDIEKVIQEHEKAEKLFKFKLDTDL